MIQSVSKAIAILEAFRPEEPRLSLSELSQRLRMPKTTVHHLLNTLAAHGLIEKTDDGRYALGAAIISLTQAVRINVELRDRAAPLLRELADACRESVYLMVLDGDHGLYIYAIESPRRLLARTAVGDRVPLHCTSLGKAILSALPEEEMEEIVARVGLPRFTPATITTLEALRQELAETRERGYAIDHGEHEKGIYCVGAPILRHDGRVIGACSVSGQDPAIAGDRAAELARLVVHTAQEISRRMGYVATRPSSIIEVGGPVLASRSDHP